MHRQFLTAPFVILCIVFHSFVSQAIAEHRVLLHGGERLAIVEADGRISWEMPWANIHDIHMLDNGNILTRRGTAEVVEIDPASKQVVWEYDSAKSNGNESIERVEVHAFERLENGHTMIAESGAARVVEGNRQGELIHQFPLELDKPNFHSDTRMVRSTPAGTYLVAHENDGKVREYNRDTGKVVWEYEVPMFGKTAAGGHGPEAFGNKLFCAIRLANGHTLIGTGNGHSVLEVTPEKEIVWAIHQNDLPQIRLAWVTTLEVMPSGNYLLGNCHAGKGQPLLIEIEPAEKKVVWTLDRWDDFGNNVSNSTIID